MNERIYEAAKQAGLLPRHLGPVVETRHTAKKKQDLEKFAELIVRECVSIANSGIDPDESHLIGDDILKHFGVER